MLYNVWYISCFLYKRQANCIILWEFSEKEELLLSKFSFKDVENKTILMDDQIIKN